MAKKIKMTKAEKALARAIRKQASARGRMPGGMVNPEGHSLGGSFVETYKGHNIYFAGTSYNAPSLSLWGYRTDLELRRAIGRAIGVKKRKKSTKKKNPPLLTVWPNPGAVGAIQRTKVAKTPHGWYVFVYSYPNEWIPQGPPHRTKKAAEKHAKSFNLPAKKAKKKASSKKTKKNPPSRYPFRSGQMISLEAFNAWLKTQPAKVKAAYRKAMRDYKKFHMGAQPTSISFEMMDLGGGTMLPPEILYSAGAGPTETYTPAGNSKKAPHSYRHEYKDQPQVLVGGKKGKQFVLKPLTGRARVDDWFRD
jgi:hypothetical protein